MNERFFELKKEKQERMINAALKVFAEHGYYHSSTDEIVKTANISKGLLFHYFGNKIGLYSFLYDYATRSVTLEFSVTFLSDCSVLMPSGSIGWSEIISKAPVGMRL